MCYQLCKSVAAAVLLAEKLGFHAVGFAFVRRQVVFCVFCDLLWPKPYYVPIFTGHFLWNAFNRADQVGAKLHSNCLSRRKTRRATARMGSGRRLLDNVRDRLRS